MKNENVKLLAALLGGAAAGAALAVLFAPEKGKDLRKHIVRDASDLKNDITGKLKELSGMVSGIADAAKK